MSEEPILIDKALVIEPGKTYVVEIDCELDLDARARMAEQWNRLTGSQLMVLAPGMRIVTEQELVKQ